MNGFVQELNGQKFRKLTTANIVAFWVFFVVIASNIVQAFVSTGPPPFWGQGDPVRFSWNPKFSVWSAEGWSDMRAPTNFLGKRDVNLPDLASKPSKDFSFSGNYEDSPFEIEKELLVSYSKIISLNLNSPISDINYANGKMLIATENHGLYVSDKSFDKITSHLILDPYYSATIDKFAGISAFGDTLRIMGMNKTSVDIRENPKTDKIANYRYFVEGADKFDELGRDRLKTAVRKIIMF